MEAFNCPLCGSSFSIEGHSLRCERGHCFDIARSGSVNFAPQAKPIKHYDRATFSDRARVMESGVYAGISQALLDTIQSLKVHTVLDAGCGEGYFTRTLSAHYPVEYYAFDLSKESIRLAAGHRNASVHYFVADLTHVPLKDHRFDCILNIFAPAHYAEFARLLRKEGVLLKVIPAAEHLQEIREHIQAPPYSNESVLNHLKEHFGEVQTISVLQRVPIGAEVRDALLRMTPLLQGVEIEAYDFSALHHVTIAADILLARA